MTRGRRAKPAEIKQAMGNPGKRPFALTPPAQSTAAPAPASLQPPAWLTGELEREAFRLVTESLPTNLLRQSDINTLARWAVWMGIWIECKQLLHGKKHFYTTKSNFVEIHREHPIAKRMDRAEAHLVTLDDRLCLNIVARNNVMHRLMQAPAPHPGQAGMFEPATPEEEENANQPMADSLDLDPLGFVERAGKQFN